MNDNTENFYDQLKTILLLNSTLRWISKEKYTELSREKIEAVNISYSTVLFKFPKNMFLGDSTSDSIRARAKLSVAKNNAGNVMSWQQLFHLFNDQANLLLLREKRQEPGYYTQYILVLRGMRFMGIKTIVIDHDAKN